MGRGRASSAGGTSGGSIQPHSGQQQPLHASGPIPFSINPWHHDDAQNDQNHDGLQYYSNNVVPQNQRYGCIRLVLVDEVAARNSNPMAEYDQLAQFDQLLSIAAWYATLEINSLDLPSLFEQGLYWSSVNIDPTKNWFSQVEPEDATNFDMGYRHMRHYELTDTGSPGTPSKWCGGLTVYGRTVRTLTRFKPDHLSPSSIHRATAYNFRGQLVYNFDKANTHLSYSAIVEDSPLQGWWPWPDSTALNESPGGSVHGSEMVE